jgi:hypothetical protein
MDLNSTFFSRNDFTDEWEPRWKRYRRNEKSLFALGSYDVRLTRLDEKYCVEGEIYQLRRNAPTEIAPTDLLDAVLALISEAELKDYLSISSNDTFMIL